MAYHPRMLDPRVFRNEIVRFRLIRRVDWDHAASQAEFYRELASSTGVPVMMMQSDPFSVGRSNFAVAMAMRAIHEGRVVSFVSTEMSSRDMERRSR